jgi:hypothetical protein
MNKHPKALRVAQHAETSIANAAEWRKACVDAQQRDMRNVFLERAEEVVRSWGSDQHRCVPDWQMENAIADLMMEAWRKGRER